MVSSSRYCAGTTALITCSFRALRMSSRRDVFIVLHGDDDGMDTHKDDRAVVLPVLYCHLGVAGWEKCEVLPRPEDTPLLGRGAEEVDRAPKSPRRGAGLLSSKGPSGKFITFLWQMTA